MNVEGVFLKNSCTDYFYNLGDRFPANLIGSCGYTSVSTLLMYYDYSFDDSLIDERYEDRSEKPYGLNRIDRQDVSGYEATQYYDYLVDHTDDYFQAYLIVEANKKFSLFDPHSASPFALNYGSMSRLSDYYEEAHAVLDYYIHDLRGYSEEQYSVRRIKENIRDTVIDKVKEGVPVLMSVSRKGKEHHLLICYDYDEDEDELYANALWTDNCNHLKLSSLYDTMTAPIYIVKY